MTGVIVGLVSVALAFASNFLLLRMAESEFNSAKQFMQTLGLQIDDVAWWPDLTETVRYTSQYGNIAFQPALNYTVYVKINNESNYQKFYTCTTGIICFNMHVSRYSLGNNFHEFIYPSSNTGFLISGPSAPVAKVFAVEKMPMTDGNFIRTIVAPTIRMLNMETDNGHYIRLYLPILLEGEAPMRSQSVTLTGRQIAKVKDSITGLKVEVDFPKSGSGFDEIFFSFPQTVETLDLEEETTLELYVGQVDVGFGVHI
jgi:hypothetical protein